MELLYWLEGLRNPVCDFIFRVLTELGSETALMAVAITVFWCIRKKWGYYIFTVGFFGTLISQLLKLICRVLRPWDLAAQAGREFKTTLEDGIRLGADDYSLPSGHTLNAASTFGGLALCARKTWPKWAIWLLISTVVLVAFSRLYLGVHTPLDVGVGLACALVLMFAFYPFVMKSDERPGRMYLLFGVMLLCCAGYVCYINFALRPEMFQGYAGEVDNYFSGVKNGWSLTGALLGLLMTYLYDSRVLHFEEKAPVLGQILKVVLGLAVMLGVRIGLGEIFKALFPGQLFWSMPRYFLMTLVAGCVWPHTFPFFQKLGRKKETV